MCREATGSSSRRLIIHIAVMNNNIIAYILYLSATVYIIYWLGRMFHRNGRVFILRLFHDDDAAADNMNNILLIAYYLFNIGYAFLKLRSWETVNSTAILISSLSDQLSILILILGFTHYFNILLIYLLSKKHNTFIP